MKKVFLVIIALMVVITCQNWAENTEVAMGGKKIKLEKVWEKELKGLIKDEKKDEIAKIVFDENKISQFLKINNSRQLTKEGINRQMLYPEFIVTSNPVKLIYYDNSGNVKKIIKDMSTYSKNGKYIVRRESILKNEKGISKSKLVFLDKEENILWETGEEKMSENEGYGFGEAWISPNGETLAVWLSYGLAWYGKIRFYNNEGKLIKDTINYSRYSYGDFSANGKYFITVLTDLIEKSSSTNFKGLQGEELMKAIVNTTKPNEYLVCFDKKGNILWQIKVDGIKGWKINERGTCVIISLENNYISIDIRNGKEIKKYNLTDGYVNWNNDRYLWKIFKDNNIFEIYDEEIGKTLTSFSLNPILKSANIESGYECYAKCLIREDYFILTYYEPKGEKDEVMLLIDIKKKKLVLKKVIEGIKKASIKTYGDIFVFGLVEYSTNKMMLFNISQEN